MERASPEGRSLSELHVRGRQSVALAPSGLAGHLFGPIFGSRMAYDLGNTLLLYVVIVF